MASVIKVRTISAVTETAIQMSNSQFGRGISITGWSTIRIGLRLHWTQDGVSHTPKFFVGLCSGTGNMFGDATTTHAVGAYLQGNETWTYGAAPDRYTDGGNGGYTAVKRVGSTLTLGTTLTQTRRFNAGALANSADRDIYLVDIIKGSPNYSIRGFFNNASATDISQATFLSQMEQATPSLTNYIWGTAQTVAVNEGTDGTLDSINIYWDLTAIKPEICDIAVARLA